MLKTGKRYEFSIRIPGNKKKNGLFTGEYNKNNGNAILITKNGETWSIPEENCIPYKR